MRKFVGPEVVAQLMHRTLRNASIVMANMVGPNEKMTVADHPVKGLYFIVSGAPLISGRNKKKQWKKVEVNFEDHIKIPIFPTNSPLEHYDDAFDEYLTKIAMDLLPQDRPLWEVHIVKYPTSKASGHLVFKLHPALGDGYSLIGALLSFSQRADDPSVPLTFPIFRTKNNRPSVGYCQRITSGVLRAVCVAYNTLCDYGSNILKSTVIEDDRTPIRSGNEDLEHKPITISTMEFSIDKIKQIKNELGMVVAQLMHRTLRNASIVMANMVGPIEKMTVADHPVKGLYFIVSGAPLSVEIAVLSYMQTLRICIGVEKNFIDLQELKSCIQKAFDEIFDAATKKGK